MNTNLLPDEIPEHPLATLRALEYQDRCWAAVCDYWQAVVEYRALLRRGERLN